jgi:hypothetical protein
MGLAPLAMRRPELLSTVLLEVVGGRAPVDLVHFDPVLEVDVVERVCDLLDHHVPAWEYILMSWLALLGMGSTSMARRHADSNASWVTVSAPTHTVSPDTRG